MAVGPREAFLFGLGDGAREAWTARADLGALIEQATAEVQREWPDSDIDRPRLAVALARAVDDEPGLALVPAPFDGLSLLDLYLAASCAAGDRAALRRFELEFGSDLDRAVARSPKLGLNASEFRQHVAVRLFVSPDPDRPPKILSYRGRGSLKAWVRVTASRLIVDTWRRRGSSEGEARLGPDLLERIVDERDPELTYLRETCGPLLEQAMTHAVGQLSVRQRNLLRQRYLHEVPSDALSTIYGVHRSTIFVWLERARATLLEQVRHSLAEVLPDHRLESLLGLLGSQIELSMRRVLDSKLEPGE